MIDFNFEDIKEYSLDTSKLTTWVQSVVSVNNYQIGDITYIFCSDNYILDINKQYLNHDYFTDIITFNYNEDDIISGDLFISLDTIKSNAELFKVTFTEELHRVIIHGILHLIGFDDKTDALQEEMTLQENKALAVLKTIL